MDDSDDGTPPSTKLSNSETPVAIPSSGTTAKPEVESDDEVPLSKKLAATKPAENPPALVPDPSVLSERENASSSLSEVDIKDESDSDVPLSRKKRRTSKEPKVPSGKKAPVKKEKPVETDSDSDAPLAKKTKATSRRVKKVVKEENSDSDVPLSKKVKVTKVSAKKETEVKVKPEPKKRKRASSAASDESDTGNKKKAITKGSVKVSKKVIKEEKKKVKEEKSPKKTKKEKVKKEEEEEEVYEWWAEQKEDDSIKWKTLVHQGVMFPPDYMPHGIKMKYDGKPVELTPECEEIASFFAALLETDHGRNPTFQQNFFADFKSSLEGTPAASIIKEFSKCDFRPMYEYFEAEKEKKKTMTKEEKLALKEAKMKLEEKYGYAYLDGRKEKVGNFRIEPPSLFRGRGEHPKTGMLKKRVMPEQVIINIGEDAPIPESIPGHKWGKVVHDNTVTWLASWKENVNNSIKYVFLAAGSSLKGQSDMKKFEKARELKKIVATIRRDYTAELRDKLMATRQRATAMYLIDRLALRAGNEKGEDEADTVGCCSLRYEHVTLEPPNKVIFDFLGKDSIRYYNEVPVDDQVFKNLRIFKKEPKTEGDMLFDRLTTQSLNNHLSSLMKGLTAKVFRTYNASFTFQEELEKTPVDGSEHDKILAYNRANRQVAVLCNHQRSVSKGHGSQMLRIGDKLRAIKLQRRKLKRQAIALDPKIKKKHPEYLEEESDLEDDWVEEYEIGLIEKEREKAQTRFEQVNERRVADGEEPLDPSTLKTQLENIDKKAKEWAMERKKGTAINVPSSLTLEKIAVQLEKLDARVAATKTQMIDKDENKTTALGTSKINYIDPRISVAWCRKHDVPLEKIFNKTLKDKFKWAMVVDEDFVF